MLNQEDRTVIFIIVALTVFTGLKFGIENAYNSYTNNASNTRVNLTNQQISDQLWNDYYRMKALERQKLNYMYNSRSPFEEENNDISENDDF